MFGGISGSSGGAAKLGGYSGGSRSGVDDDPEKLMKALARAAQATDSSMITTRETNRRKKESTALLSNPFYDLRTRSRKKSSRQQSLSTVPADEELSATKVQEKVTLNVGGSIFITFKDTLVRVPCTRLYYLMKTPVENLNTSEYDTATGAYFFDRHPGLFEHILNYYRTGQLHVPRDICWPLFENELSYWGLDHTHLESCCWMVYRHHTDNENTLRALDEEDKQEKLDPRIGDPDLNAWDRHMCKLWELIDDPMSSKTSKFIAFLSLTLIIVSVAIFCLETHKVFREQIGVTEVNVTLSNGQKISRTEVLTRPLPFLFYIETVCIVWFCVEFVIRLISCPNKVTFLKSPLNIVDFLAILPYFVDFYKATNNSTGFLRIVRICRVFRVFKLTRHLTGLKILWHTLHASMKELFILAIFMCLGVVIFASLIFYAERLFEDSNPDTDFVDIPHGFWWALVTMTTLGYGDMVPKTFSGQIVGSLCALCGLLTIALPVPVIVSNFSLYYSHYQAKVKLPKSHFHKDDAGSSSRHNSTSYNGSQTLADSPYHQRCPGIAESPVEEESEPAVVIQMQRNNCGVSQQYLNANQIQKNEPDLVSDGAAFSSLSSRLPPLLNDTRHVNSPRDRRKQSVPVGGDTFYNIYYDPQSSGHKLSAPPLLSMNNMNMPTVRDDMSIKTRPQYSLDQNHHHHQLTPSSSNTISFPLSRNNSSQSNKHSSRKQSKEKDAQQYVQVECEV